jgi:hypothetical protein
MSAESITPSKVNIVTEHKENYKLVSMSLMDSYNGLHPSSISKLAHVLFNYIIYNKMYRNPDNRYYSLEEDRRIYSNILITPESILKRIAPSKYGIDNKLISNDISNLTSRIQALEDNNVFYVWRYKQPYTYLFIMERDVGCWKYYNSSAFVTPKTLKKIVRSAHCIIDTMVKLEGKRERGVDLRDIEISFGNFLNRMIDKLNPSVIKELSRWVDAANMKDYVTRLSADLRPIDDFQGQTFAPDFINRLPDPVRNEILNKKTKTTEKVEKKGEKMSTEMLELDLVPENENITKRHRTRKPKVKDDALAPTATLFAAIDPFHNSHSFVRYYRSVIKSHNPDAKFFSLDLEAAEAEQILDLLIKNKKQNDLKFLKRWILNYFSLYLKDNNVYKPEKTTLSAFVKTFSAFNDNYYG